MLREHFLVGGSSTNFEGSDGSGRSKSNGVAGTGGVAAGFPAKGGVTSDNRRLDRETRVIRRDERRWLGTAKMSTDL